MSIDSKFNGTKPNLWDGAWLEDGDPGAVRTRDNSIKRRIVYLHFRNQNQNLSTPSRPIACGIIRQLSYCFVNYPIVTMGQVLGVFNRAILKSI